MYMYLQSIHCVESGDEICLYDGVMFSKYIA